MSAARGSAPVPRGKLTPEAFGRLIAPHLGAARGEVRSGPGPGLDSGLVDLGGGRVMAITTDPLSRIPALGPADSAWLSCHLLASDLWTSGVPPAWAAVSFHLPPGMSDGEFGDYWRAMSDEWRALGVAVVAGHTGRYAGCESTILGACTLVGVADEASVVGPEHVRAGDRVIVTKGCAIETAAVAVRLFPRRLAERLGIEAVKRARARLDQVSVVADCRAALSAGTRDRGVSAMHDATEGGVLGGLIELARASRLDLVVERARIPLSDLSRAACEAFGIDPYWTLSEGTLLVTARPARAAAVLEALAASGVAAADVGEARAGAGRLMLTEPDGSTLQLAEPLADPYWDAYERAVREGWR